MHRNGIRRVSGREVGPSKRSRHKSRCREKSVRRRPRIPMPLGTGRLRGARAVLRGCPTFAAELFRAAPAPCEESITPIGAGRKHTKAARPNAETRIDDQSLAALVQSGFPRVNRDHRPLLIKLVQPQIPHPGGHTVLLHAEGPTCVENFQQRLTSSELGSDFGRPRCLKRQFTRVAKP